MKQNRHKGKLCSQSSPFVPPEIEMFPQGIQGVVTIPVTPYKAGQIKIHGQFWRSQLYSLNCQTTLLCEQPVLAIGRENNMLIVIPHHCLLWDLYIDEFWPLLTDAEIDVMRNHERHWRKP